MDESLLLDKDTRFMPEFGGARVGIQDQIVVITKDPRHGYRMEQQPYDINEMVASVKALSMRLVSYLSCLYNFTNIYNFGFTLHTQGCFHFSSISNAAVSKCL